METIAEPKETNTRGSTKRDQKEASCNQLPSNWPQVHLKFKWDLLWENLQMQAWAIEQGKLGEITWDSQLEEKEACF